MHNNTTPPHDPNRTPETEFSEEELAALQARQAAEESPTAQALSWVDALLRNAPMLTPSAEFAERVMHAIATMPRPGWKRRELSVGVVLGLLVTALLSVPFLAGALFALVSALADAAIFSTLLQIGVSVVSGVSGLLGEVAAQMQTLVTASMWNTILIALVLPAAALWGRVLWRMWGVTQWPTRGPKS